MRISATRSQGWQGDRAGGTGKILVAPLIILESLRSLPIKIPRSLHPCVVFVICFLVPMALAARTSESLVRKLERQREEKKNHHSNQRNQLALGARYTRP